MGYTILVVENTLDSRELMRLISEAEGYRMLEAENGVAAVDIAQREQPDAFLMHMSLPLMMAAQPLNAAASCRHCVLRQSLLFTAYSHWDWRGKAILLGAPFLTKPIQTKLLFKMLNRYLPG